MNRIFRYQDGIIPNLLALGYAVLGWGLGIAALCSGDGWLEALGTLLVAHALTIGAYLIHECAHGAIFTAPRNNDRLGTALGWLSGACIAPYRGLKEKHLRHHVDRLDVVSFDYRAVLAKAPEPCRVVVLALEWAYVPAVEYLMRGLIIASQWRSGRAGRARLAGILALRLGGFTLLGLVAPVALLLYAVAYTIFLHILRFQDAFQHTYEVHPLNAGPAPDTVIRDRAYEQANTYSDVVSIDSPLLNLLVLNFAYHNAHHAKPAEPWHRLARLHRTLFGSDLTQVLPVRALLASYHRHRLARVMAPDYGVVTPEGDRAGNFLGAVGVSFLTAA